MGLIEPMHIVADQFGEAAPGFAELIADYLPMIQRIAAAHEANVTAREDLVQDILCAVWRALPKFRAEGSVRAFVARVAANRAVTHVQRALRLPTAAELRTDIAASEPGPEAQAIATDQKAQLLVALRSLPIGLREPALLALEGLTQHEIADVLGITSNAVAIRMSRARTALRNSMGR